MHLFDFDRAIVREPSRSVVDGLRSDSDALPDYDVIVREHTAYIAALRGAGLAVEVLPPLEPFPDSMFVEDPALVFPEAAVLLRPGAPSRLGETEEMRPALKRQFQTVLELGSGQSVDGGDVLITLDSVVIGISARTSTAGADALSGKLASLGRTARTVPVPESMLHLKSGAALLDEETLLATRRMESTGLFAGFRTILAPEGESAAANAIRINGTVFVGGCYPRTLDLLAKENFRVVPLPVTEVAKLDAGLSCMSLRWRSKAMTPGSGG
ncbi:MAG TPA: arginine deiminase family protein [Rhizomicrobium sp.]|jgi:dimethylargininase|nr:arginine deiminase family protein [Rhizomicrobium sp.]